jgi:hypothetical protein
LREYVEASSKFDKSLILLGIMRRIHRSNEDQIGFVKQDLKTGKWVEINEFASRVVVAQAFRDALSTHYKSSKQSKQHKRRVERMKASNNSKADEVVDGVEPDLMSLNKVGMMNIPCAPMMM